MDLAAFGVFANFTFIGSVKPEIRIRIRKNVLWFPQYNFKVKLITDLI